MEPNRVMPNHVPTGTTCLECRGPAGTDDAGAYFGHGFFCKRCGCYRLHREVKPQKAD